MKPWTLHRAGRAPIHIERVQVMAILNATPDSFSDGGEIDDAGALHARIVALLDGGADMIDIGGESTRPGSQPVDADEQIRRVLPVIQAVRSIGPDVPISIDTASAEVAAAALAAGADLINDVRGLRGGTGNVAATHGCSIVAMRDEDCGPEVLAGAARQFDAIRQRALAQSAEHLILDPGLGFGAAPGPHVAANLALVDAAVELADGAPVLIGASRKRFIGAMMDEPDPKRRVAGSVEVAVRAAAAGASILRVHDVAATIAGLESDGFR